MYEYTGIYNTPMAFLPSTTTCPVQLLARNEAAMGGVSECLLDVIDFYAASLLCGQVLARMLETIRHDSGPSSTALREPCVLNKPELRTPKSHETLGDTSEDLASAFHFYVIESLARPAPDVVVSRSIDLLQAQHEQTAVGTLTVLQQERSDIEARQKNQAKALAQAITARRNERINHLVSIIRHETASMFHTSAEHPALLIALRVARDRLAARVSDGGWENVRGANTLAAPGSVTLYNNTTREYGERPVDVTYSWYLDTVASLLYLG